MKELVIVRWWSERKKKKVSNFLFDMKPSHKVSKMWTVCAGFYVWTHSEKSMNSKNHVQRLNSAPQNEYAWTKIYEEKRNNKTYKQWSYLYSQCDLQTIDKRREKKTYKRNEKKKRLYGGLCGDAVYCECFIFFFTRISCMEKHYTAKRSLVCVCVCFFRWLPQPLSAPKSTTHNDVFVNYKWILIVQFNQSICEA